jgi:uncharacterized protein (TIGR02145 family)
MKDKISIFLLFLTVFAFCQTGCKKADKPPDPVYDIQGNTYKTVKIGTRIWMAENLKTTKFNDGTDIPLITDAAGWSDMATPGYCWYNNDSLSFKDTFGALYNGYTVVTGKLCPVGWHVPELVEWQALNEFLGDSLKGGGKLKEAGIIHWLSPNKGADNSSGFTALGAGLRYFEGTFASLLSFTSIWAATITATDDEWYTGLYFNNTAFITDHKNKKNGFSVRCLRN